MIEELLAPFAGADKQLMRTEITEPVYRVPRTRATYAPRDVPTAPPPVATRRRGLDRFELAVLAAFAGVSAWILGLDIWQVIAHGRVWTGTDGVYLTDQMQYLAWIQGASHGLLSSNLFVLRTTPADYFQPGIAISGALAALGVAPWLALLVWKPVAVVSTFFVVRAYARRSLRGRAARRVALVLGLFFGSFSIVYGSLGVVGDLWLGFWAWGYTFGLIAIAAMLGALLAYDRARSAKRLAWTPALLGALASSLHPWQGETLILIVIGAELLMWDRHEHIVRRLIRPTVTVVGTSLPLLYYLILGHIDESWKLARDGSHHTFSLLTIGLGLAPLLIPAAFAYRSRPRSFIAAATRAWPIAALVIYLLSETTFSATPLHAFGGITIPLAVLAIEGARRMGWQRIPRRRLLGSLAIAAVTVPAAVFELNTAHRLAAPAAGNANFITHDERRALDYLADDRAPGGVFTRFYLGTVVPAETGRRTFVGDCLWSEPNCSPHAQVAQQLFEGSLAPRAARELVLSSGARFVLADCQTNLDMKLELAPIIRSTRRFGCAAVYTVDPSPPSAAP